MDTISWRVKLEKNQDMKHIKLGKIFTILSFFRKNSYTYDELVLLADRLKEIPRDCSALNILMLCCQIALEKDAQKRERCVHLITIDFIKHIRNNFLTKAKVWWLIYRSSIEDLPLLINSENLYLKAVSEWRLFLGR